LANLKDCIEAAVATGKISDEEAQDLARRIDQYQDQIVLRGEVSPEAALSEAEQAVLKAKGAELALKKRQARLQAVALHKITNQVQDHPAGVKVGVMSLLVKDVGSRAAYSNIDARGNAILATYHAKFAEAMDKFRTKNLGFSQDVDGLRNMVRELFNSPTGDSTAASMAKIWSDTAEMARVRFNRAGGAIPKREDWGMPQWHDPVRVSRVSKENWIDGIKDKLDRNKMLDDAGLPINDMQLEQMLARSYDEIATDGLASMTPGRMGGSKLANRHRDHRTLPFKTADDWLEYHDNFGHADLYATLTDHLSSMANDTAKLEILGPNPQASWRYMRDMALKDAEGEGLDMALLDSVWRVVSGEANQTKSVKLADFMQSVRSLLVASKLGGAMLSAVSDTAFLKKTSSFNGIPATKVFQRMSSLLNPANEADRLTAVKMQLTADAWANHALAANRFTEVTGAGFSAKIADFTMRASMLSAWTDAGRKAFGMEFQSLLGDMQGKALAELPQELQGAFKRYGITGDDWEIMRATDPLTHKGVNFFSPEKLMERADLDESKRISLATKLQEMIITEMDFAVPMPDARVRAITTGGLPRGSIMGEITRGVGMFKSFPITVIATHLYRGALQEGISDKAKYLAGITIGTTVMGLVAMQMKEVSRGKEPRDMTDPKTWGAAFLQGGGAGIYGDFLTSDANRFGGGPLDTSLGPMYALGEDAFKLTLGNVQQGLRGDDMNLGGDIINFARQYTPGGSLWYTRLAYERMVLDQLQKAADPNAGARFRRIQQRRAKDYNQSYFWKPGETAPGR